MNLFRIVQNKTNKRQDNGGPYREVCYVLLFVFLLPYVISCLWGHVGEESELLFQKEESQIDWIDEKYFLTLSGKWGKKQISMQEYLVRKLEMVMPEEEGGEAYEPQALMAQAVLLRTEVWGLFLENEGQVAIQDDIGLFTEYSDTSKKEENTRCREAVCGTDGLFLSYDSKPVKAAFFPVSNGQTREAAEVFPDNGYPYLRRVKCEQDILARTYQSQNVLSKEEFFSAVRDLFSEESREDKEIESLWNALEFVYDGSDYVIEVRTGDFSCSGEAFRYALGLSSASFRADWGDSIVTFYVKGVGHGFGMSQYGANKMALSGERFDEILHNYFFQAELVKIE